MNFLTKFSLKNVSAVLLLCVLIVVGGVYSSLQLKKETMPDVSIPIVGIITVYPGAAPGDVKDNVTKPMEEAVMGVQGIKSVNSTSSENVSSVIAQFDYSANMEESQRKVEEAIKSVTLPDGAVTPKIMRVDLESFPVLNISISNNKLSPESLEQLVRQKIIPVISGIAGVGQAQMSGGNTQAVYIKLLPDKLKENNLTFQTVMQLLQASNVSFPTGSATINNINEPVRVVGQFSTVDELKSIQLPVVPNSQDALKSTLTQMGEGMTSLGKAVGELGSGMLSLGKAVGDIGTGMTGMNQALSGEIQLLQTITDLQSQLFGARLALSEASQTSMNPNSTPAQKQAAQLTIQQLTPQVQLLQGGLDQAQAKLKEIQAQVAAQTRNSGTSNAIPAGVDPSGRALPQMPQSTGISMPTTLKTVSLGDIADITIGTGKSTSYSRTNGNPSIIIQVIKTQDANTIDVSDAVMAKINEIQKNMPELTVTPILNQADYVKESVGGMLKEGILGAFFAFLVILLFLRNFRTTIIASISIPLSIFITLAFLKQLNITLNIVTLGGLSVAVGRIVDDSIVVIENIYRHMQSGKVRNSDLIKFGTREVASAITSSTLTTVAVFLPMAFLGGFAGIMFKPFATTVTIALLSSLLVAVTVIPVLSRLLLLNSKKTAHSFHESRLMNGYQSLLGWSLNHKAIVLLIALALLAGSVSLFGSIGTSFMPADKDKYISITMTYPPGTDVEIVNKKAAEIEKVLQSEKGIDMFQMTSGSSSDYKGYGSLQGNGDGNFLIRLSENENVDKLVSDLKGKIKPDDNKSDITINQTNVSSTSGSGEMNNLSVTVVSDNMDNVEKYTSELTETLKTVQGLENVSNNLSEHKPEIIIKVDQKKAAGYGLSAGQTGLAIRGLLNDTQLTTMTVNNETMDVNIGIKINNITRIEDIKNMELASPLGSTIKVSDIAAVEEAPGPVSIFAENGNESARVTAKITEKNTGAVSKRVQEKIDTMSLPAGVSIKMGGVSQMMSDMFRDLIFSMITAVFAVFIVMMVALGEAVAPMAILFSLPLAAIGGLIALFITGLPLDMPSMIGALMLIGIVVTNAIVLIDRVQHSRKDGMPLREALLEAGKIRMRPILMTAIATIAALVPLSLGLSKGSVISQSLAVIVIGGLATSTFLTLVVVPVAYEMLEKLKEKLGIKASD